MNLLLYNGHIHTLDDFHPLAQAALIQDGRFQAVGESEEILHLNPGNIPLLNLQGAHAYPGLTDSHLHILSHAIASRALVLNGFRSRQAALDAISAHALSFPEGSCLDGRGFNEDLWEDQRLITRRELDKLVPGRGIRLTRVCGHMVVANSMALELAGITPDTPVPKGGEVDWERGLFCENAIGLLFPAEKDAGVETCKELLLEGMNKAADGGLTAIFSDDIGTGGYSMHTVIKAYQELEKEGRMPVRVVEQCALPNHALFHEFLDSGYAYGQGTDYFRIGPRKLYADGSLGARTAWLSRPYADDKSRRGVPIYKQEELNDLAKRTHMAHMPLIVHAIGDAAVDSVLQAIDFARREVPGTDDLPDGIVHCQITTPELLSRIIRDHVCVYAQPVFTEYDLHICRDRVGEELEMSSYNWKTLLHSGVCISSGSDCPVEPLDALKNIYCASTRKDFLGIPEKGWMPDQCLTVKEALLCHTVQAARAVGMEDVMGKIRPGYLADLSVFPDDLEKTPPADFLNIQPVMTIVGGKIRRHSPQMQQ